MSQPLLHVVLHQPDIPQNTGNIGRSCVAVGAKLWLVRPLGFLLDARHLKRAGMDYWEHLDWEAVDNWSELRQRLHIPSTSLKPADEGPGSARRQQFWYLTKTATRLLWDAKFEPGDVLVFGSETRGLPASILTESPEHNLKLPMSPLVRSLNLASTANTVMYEAVRQFGGLPLSGS